eukprot:1157581-Pelagomonas_calceolata.AAC.2
MMLLTARFWSRHVRDSHITSPCNSPLHIFCQAIHVIDAQGKQQGGKWAALLNSKMRANGYSLAAIHQDVLIICIHAFNDSQQANRHTDAL